VWRARPKRKCSGRLAATVTLCVLHSSALGSLRLPRAPVIGVVGGGERYGMRARARECVGAFAGEAAA